MSFSISEKYPELVSLTTKNVGDMINIALEHTSNHNAVVIFDTDTELTQIITEGYRNALPEARFINFSETPKEDVILAFDSLLPHDLVVLIQSTDFRLNEFRIRIHLFQKELKVIDHQHLYRNDPDSWITYIHAIAYDPSWYRTIGPKLKNIIDASQALRFVAPDGELLFTNGFESSKLNIGDYREMKNIGGTFPIGEVFTEAKELQNANGAMYIYAFAGTDYHIHMHDPFRVDIKDGLVVGWSSNTPVLFTEVIAQIQKNERAIIREIGFGLNRAITRENYVKDITAFERLVGVHFSLGEKHTVYKKQGITPDKTRFHVDVFPVIESVFADEKLIFQDDMYVV